MEGAGVRKALHWDSGDIGWQIIGILVRQNAPFANEGTAGGGGGCPPVKTGNNSTVIHPREGTRFNTGRKGGKK